MSDERAANALDTRLGQRVRARRLEIGMSQEKLADTLGVTFQQVQKYEKGVNRIAASRLFAIAAALDVPISRLFEGIEPGRQRGVAEGRSDMLRDVLSTPEGAETMALFGVIKNQRVRRRVVALVRAVADEHAEAAKTE